MSGEAWQRGALDLAADIRGRRLTCVEAMNSVLSRIERTNPIVNAVTAMLADRALEMARRADALLQEGHPLRALHGVPFTVKDAVDLAGAATTDGIPHFRDRIASADAPIVRQLRLAGAIPIGKTNMSEGAVRWQTTNILFGETWNPWDRTRTVGGSCGGSAVAVAVGMGPLSVGNDIGGSLRWPAQCCGVTSIKPSRGRISSATSTRTAAPTVAQVLFSSDGLMARGVADLRTTLRLVSGPDARDPWWVPAPLEWAGASSPRRVALTLSACGPGPDRPIDQAVRQAAAALAAAGYAVDEIDPPHLSDMTHLWRSFVAAQKFLVRPSPSVAFGPDTQRYLSLQRESEPAVDQYSFMECFQKREQVMRDWDRFFGEHDLVLGPVSTRQPFLLGTDISSAAAVAEIFESHRLTLAANYLGLPALVVPVAVVDGIPAVAQLLGPRYGEDACIDAAEVIEQSCGRFVPIPDPNPCNSMSHPLAANTDVTRNSAAPQNGP
jgi:amidase